MPIVDVIVETEISRSPRARQLEGMFDVPPATKQRLEWHGDIPIDAGDWSVGLIVGPSGSGKTTIARQVFGAAVDRKMRWKGASCLDDFGDDAQTHTTATIQAITDVCQAVGFNTIPAWLRPYKVLSNGEKFRVDLARRLIELKDPIVVDEFSSVVDRQVAKIASHAVQKFVRRNDRKFVAVSCHHDIIDWLQPDWIFEPASMRFDRRSVRSRPKVECVVGRVPRAAWALFSRYHYMSAEMHNAAQCFGLWADGILAGFCGVMFRPNTKREPIYGVSRVVVLPDFQGLGLSFVLTDTLGAAYVALNKRFRNYPAQPAYIRAIDRSPNWTLVKRPGTFGSPNRVPGGKIPSTKQKKGAPYQFGGRPNTVFEFVGKAMKRGQADSLINSFKVASR